MSETMPTYWTSHVAVMRDPLAFYDAVMNEWLTTGEVIPAEAPDVAVEPIRMGVNMATAISPIPTRAMDGSLVTVAAKSAVATYGVMTHPAQPLAHSRLMNPVSAGAVVATSPNLLVVVLRMVEESTGTQHDHVVGFNGMNSYFRTLTSVDTLKVRVPDHESPRVYGNMAVVGVRTLEEPAKHWLVGIRANPGEEFFYFLAERETTDDDRVLVGANVILIWFSEANVYALAGTAGEWTQLTDAAAHPADICDTGANVALVIQPDAGLLHAFSALASEVDGIPIGWVTHACGDDPVIRPALPVFGRHRISGNVALVTAPSRGLVYAFSAITGEWSSIEADAGAVMLEAGDDSVTFLGPSS